MSTTHTAAQLRNRLKHLRGSLPLPQAHKQFRDEFYCQLGIRQRVEGTDSVEEVRDDLGRRTRAKGAYDPREFSLADAAEAVFGHEGMRTQFGRPGEVDALEAAAAQDPSTLQQVSLYNQMIAGLVEAEILKDYDEPEFIADKLIPTKNTKKNGGKRIGLYGAKGKDENLERKPGQPHQRADITARYIKTPETVEKAQAIDVLKETVYFDLTGDVLDQAQSIRLTLKYEREEDMLRTILGIDNSFHENGVGYNTFQTSAPWINDHVNPLVDFNDIDDAIELFTKMRHPHTGRVYGMSSDAMIVIHDPRKESLWATHTQATELRQTTNTNNQTISGQTQQVRSIRNRYSSAIARDLLVASGLSEANAIGAWFGGRPEQAFEWQENWPLEVVSAPATNYDMIDRGLYASFFANYRGSMAVIDPRKWLRNKNA